MRVPAMVGALLLSAGSAQAIGLLGLNTQNQLVHLDTANPAAAFHLNISGLAVGDSLVGIDTRPTDGKVYGVSLSNKIYTIDSNTGAASFVANLSSPVVQPGLGYGIDFNPVADGGGGSSLRLVSSAGSNFAINAGTGVVGNAASNIGPGYTAVGYSNATPFGPTPASTALYYINSDNDSLYMAPSAFNSPTISLVGALGVDVLKANGFELLPDNTAYAAFNIDNGSLTSGLYSINLATGQASLLGNYQGTLTGLTHVSPIPEPESMALMLAGLLGLARIVRRRAPPASGDAGPATR